MGGRIEEFISYLESEQRASSHTLEAYGRDLRQFADWLRPENSEEGIDWELVATSDIREWIGTLAEHGLQPSSLRRKSQSLRAFYHWGHKREIFKKNPAADLILVKKGKKLPGFIKEKEVEDLLSADPEAESFAEARAHILLTLLYSLGLRQAELLNLTDNDIRSGGRELRILGKRNKERIVPVPDSLAEEIREWQKKRDEYLPDLPAPRPLAAGKSGTLSKTSLYLIIRRALAPTSAGRKSPHTLRHTFATAMLNHGADIDAVREMLGHTSLQTTQIYTHVSARELLANYRNAHPRARNLHPDKQQESAAEEESANKPTRD